MVSSTGLYYMAFTGMATLTRKINWAVVEQHGLVHQWRSSSGLKKERFGVFDMVLLTNDRRAGKRFIALAVRSGEQHWPVL